MSKRFTGRPIKRKCIDNTCTSDPVPPENNDGNFAYESIEASAPNSAGTMLFALKNREEEKGEEQQQEYNNSNNKNNTTKRI